MKELIQAVATKFNLSVEDVAINIWGYDFSGSFYKDTDGGLEDIDNTLIMFDDFLSLTVEDVENCQYNAIEEQYYVENGLKNHWKKEG